MMYFEGIIQFIRQLDKKEFRLYALLYILLCMASIGGMITYHIYTIQDYKSKVQQLNKTRKKVQQLLTQFASVEQQRKNVDKLLKEEKNFYLQKFFDDVAKTTKVDSNSKSNMIPKAKLANGYTEEKLNVTLTDIDTKQLTELLEAIEKKERVYIESVDISRKVHGKKITVTMLLATLLPKDDEGQS